MHLFEFLVISAIIQFSSSEQIWSYECNTNNYCIKTRIKSNSPLATSLASCQILCSKYAAIWPKPTGQVRTSKRLSTININKIEILFDGDHSPVKPLVTEASSRFKKIINYKGIQEENNNGSDLTINLLIADKEELNSYNQNESYNLEIDSLNHEVVVNIKALNFFGARNGLETLCQVIHFDDIRNQFKILYTMSVSDVPVYSHRGISLDTARNYVSVDTIKRTIEGMAASKLNVFHWHITDSQSFPYVIDSLPELSKLGAYTPRKIYTKENIKDIIGFAKVRGVYVVPEFDAPAHVGEGWQDTGYLACFNKKPWQSYCVEPPCGQLDPTKVGMYDVLEKIYADMVEKFDPIVFHMGGDEVNTNCWNSEPEIVEWMQKNGYEINEAGFIKLWSKFQGEALERFEKQRGRKIPIVLWSSTLTDEKYLKYLNNDTYIIQVWSSGDDPSLIKRLHENGFKTILSNSDALYLDCGFANWVGGSGNNWCSPYIGWQKVYENSPTKVAGEFKDLMIGSEVALWTEQADDSSIDTRLWPRAAALAERLWSDPETTYNDAEDRFLIHRERLVNMKIAADTIAPEWCNKYQSSCPTNGANNSPILSASGSAKIARF